MAVEYKEISEVTETNEIEVVWEAQEAEEINKRETEEVEEIKEAKGLEKSANQPLSDSPLIAESKGASSALKLPAGPLRHVFSFFTPQELARMSTVSKGFLSSANERNVTQNRRSSITSRELGFGLNENMEIDRQIRQAEAEAAEAKAKEFKADAALPFAALHRTLLRSWYQKTPLQQQSFQLIRAEILAGKLSVSEAIKQINKLANVSKGFCASKLPLAKLLAQVLQPWQKNALEGGLTFEVLCSTWLKEEVATPLLGQHTAEQLHGLSEYQIKGLANGFTRDQVTAPGFTRMHVEARRTAPEFRSILEDALVRRFSAEEWRTLLATPIVGKSSLLHRAIAGNHFDLMLAMLEMGQYTQEQLRALIARPAAVNAVMAGNLAMISTVRDICGAEQWKRYIDEPLPSDAANMEGLNCLWIALYQRKVSVVKMLREEFSPGEWIVRITTPISRDYAGLRLKAGVTPLYYAAPSGPMVAALLKGYTKQQWRQSINMPLTQAQGPDKGATPVSIADFYSADDAVKTMREGGGYSQEEWNKLPKGRKWNIPFLIGFGWPGLSKNAIAEGSSAVSESVENTATLASSHSTSSGKR